MTHEDVMHSHDHEHEHGDDHGDTHGQDQAQNGEIKYWRSVDFRERTPEYVNAARDEFKPGDSEVTGLQRREMLKLMGASMALAGAGVACRRPEETIMPYTHAPENVIPGLPNFFATARASTFGASGLLVESHENRPTKIEGNPEHPVSLGAASSQDQASVLELYDPDRSKVVLTKARGGQSPTTWMEWDTFAQNNFKQFAASKGQGLFVVYPGHGCPTQDRILREMKAQMPMTQIFAYDPMQEVNTAKGAELAFGSGARVLNNFANAKVILTVHADPLMKGASWLKNARGFGAGRKLSSAQEAANMNRLYSVEAEYSVTGTNADHRVRLPVGQGGDFLVALSKALGQNQIVLPESLKSQIANKQGAAGNEKVIKALAKDLAANKGRSLIVVGESQEPWVHALGHALNVALGSNGQTTQVVKAQATIADGESFDGLTKLAQALNAGQVKSLVVLDVNLAYATPGSLQMKAALEKAQTLIHAGSYVDETGKLAQWHIPLSHFLEAWGDATAWDGHASIQQPLIAPLHDTRSVIEILAQIQSGLVKKGYELVQATWRTTAGPLAADKPWRAAVHDGIIANTAFPSIPANVNAGAIAEAVSKASAVKTPTLDNVEVLFDFDHRILDGRLANIGWMQELPDPITKLTWDNALLVSPSLAKQMGLKSRVKERYYVGDVVTLTVNGASLDVPTFVVPGLAEFTVIATLGFGRTDAGKIGSNVGYDAYALWPKSGARVAQGAQLKRTSKTFDLASTQEQFAMNADTIQEVSTLSLMNRDPARVATIDGYKADPKYAENKGLTKSLMHKEGEPARTAPLQVVEPWTYNGNKWGMVIDLTSCIGCNACVTACQSENNIPVVGKTQVMRSRAMHWIRIDRYFTGDVNEPVAIAQPVPCMHCENAPCEPVCPVAATAHDKEGINAMSYNRCVGTRYCGNNCPYKVRRFNYLDFSHSGNLYVDPEDKERSRLLRMQANPDVTIRYRGVMEKCTYCVQRVQEAKIQATRNKEDPNALKDGAVTPACAQTCPTQAITFGNLNDKESRVSKLKLIDRNYDMLNELNVRPRTSYLGKLRNPNPELV